MIVTYCSIFAFYSEEKRKKDILLIRVKLEYFFFLSDYVYFKHFTTYLIWYERLGVDKFRNLICHLFRVMTKTPVLTFWEKRTFTAYLLKLSYLIISPYLPLTSSLQIIQVWTTSRSFGAVNRLSTNLTILSSDWNTAYLHSDSNTEQLDSDSIFPTNSNSLKSRNSNSGLFWFLLLNFSTAQL